MAGNNQLALHLTEAIAGYMQAKFRQLQGPDDHVPFPSDWDLTLLQECDQAVGILVEAYRNPYKTNWRAEDYVEDLTERATGQNEKVEAKLRKKYPPIFSPNAYHMKPCTVKDEVGNMMLWYIPGALTVPRSTQIWQDMKALEGSLHIKKNCNNWRVGPTHFRVEEGWLKPGSVSMSPAWFQQGHEKSNKLEVSAEILKQQTMAWLKMQMRASALIGGILSVVHPELYAAGIDCLRALNDDPGSVHKGEALAAVLNIWSSPFTAITTISNRDTPYHRDNGSAHSWFDILVALGEYENGRIEFPGLGMRLKYDPGTVVAFTGRVLQHGANCPGDRACIAYHMKLNAVQELGVTTPSWVNETLLSL